MTPCKKNSKFFSSTIDNKFIHPTLIYFCKFCDFVLLCLELYDHLVL